MGTRFLWGSDKNILVVMVAQTYECSVNMLKATELYTLKG